MRSWTSVPRTGRASPGTTDAAPFGGRGNLLKLHAAPARHPFVAAGSDRRPCPRHGRWPAMGGMQNESAVIATAPQPGHYEIDPSQSRVTFTTRHLFGLGRVKGSFTIRGGTADIADPVAASAIYAEIETASFRTNSSQRDRSVLS